MIEDLCRPHNLPGGSNHVELVTTHGSVVFLTEDSVFKVKRARDFGFMDYSTIQRRQAACQTEVRLNRRTAASVYHGVLPVFRDAAGYSLVRGGAIVDWAVHMRRLPDERCARTMLAAGALAAPEVAAIADGAAAFYASVDRYPPAPEVWIASCEENFAQTERFVGVQLERAVFDRVVRRQREWIERNRARIEHRDCRDGHGDLRLEHVYLLDGGPVLIDCIEFDAKYRIADPALDAAFLVMDLGWRGHTELAQQFAQRFAESSCDPELLSLLEGYVSYRALVRAKVACLVATDAATHGDRAVAKAGEAASLLAYADSGWS